MAALCFIQLKNPRTLIVNGAYPTIGDPRNYYKPALGTIFHNIGNY
ncbi:MAG: hypothetical protein ACOCP4_01600 [Candidatus Woesearchaeota archaeon]